MRPAAHEGRLCEGFEGRSSPLRRHRTAEAASRGRRGTGRLIRGDRDPARRGCRPRGARGAHGAPGHVRLAASMNPDAHVRCTSPPHSVPSPGAMLSSMAQNLGYLNDAAFPVCGRHPRRTSPRTCARSRVVTFCGPFSRLESAGAEKTGGNGTSCHSAGRVCPSRHGGGGDRRTTPANRGHLPRLPPHAPRKNKDHAGFHMGCADRKNQPCHLRPPAQT